mgnify:CR=1 FL=1
MKYKHTATINGKTFTAELPRICNYAWIVYRPSGKINCGFSKTYNDAKHKAWFFGHKTGATFPIKIIKLDNDFAKSEKLELLSVEQSIIDWVTI